MKHKDFTNRADLLEAAAHSIRMQEAAGIEPVCSYVSNTRSRISSHYFTNAPSSYEFPLAVVEGNPVFEGDELYDELGGKHTVPFITSGEKMTFTKNNKWSWNPPKPRTVMVEMLVEDAHAIINYGIDGRLSEACRKALEAQASLTMENKND